MQNTAALLVLFVSASFVLPGMPLQWRGVAAGNRRDVFCSMWSKAAGVLVNAQILPRSAGPLCFSLPLIAPH